MVTTLLVSFALAQAPKADTRLVGTWMLGAEPFMTLNANGTGVMDEGALKWKADGASLIITDADGTADKASYRVDGSQLVLTLGGVPLTLTRAGGGVEVKKKGALAAKAAKAAAVSEEEADREALAEAQQWLQKNGQGGAQGQQQQGAPAPGRAQPQRRGAGADQLSQLLLSSGWCSFRYNKTTGSSSTEKFRFFPDGTWSNGGRDETYNSGANGTVSGQYDSSGGGQWEVRQGQLLMSSQENPVLQVVPNFSVTRNSNGSPIINSAGKEYSMCN